MSTTTTTQNSTTTTRLTADQAPPSEDTQPSSNSSSISTAQQNPNSTTKDQQQDPAKTTPTTQPRSTAENEQVEIYDEIEIEDMTYDATLRIYHYPCPCGDRFEISVDAMRERSEDVAVCPGCSLMVRVVYDVGDLPQK